MDKSELSAPMRAAVEMLQAKGFTVYMREAKDTYAYYTDGTGISRFEVSYFVGYNLSTVHNPDINNSFGYVVFRDETLAVFERNAASAFHIVPDWVSRRGLKEAAKFPNWNAFANYCDFNKGFKAVQ